MRAIIVFLSLFLILSGNALGAEQVAKSNPVVYAIKVHEMILPGTAQFLKRALQESAAADADLLIVELNTPGGLLNSAQEMVQALLSAPIPTVVLVSPKGGTATSAGVFITLAAQIAAMEPGTTIGAAHPVAGDGKDIEGDMRAKAENIAMAMVRSIAEQRGRNATWAEQAVKNSSSLTEREALEQKVIDLVVSDRQELLKKLSGREVQLAERKIKIRDLSSATIVELDASVTEDAINFLANPTVAALLWMAATTGISIELYHPGAILPGVVGVICLILALAAQQVIPLNMSGVLLLVIGTALMAAELFVTSGILGIGGIIAVLIGAFYLVDVAAAPGMAVAMEVILPIAVFIGASFIALAYLALRTRNRPAITGATGMVGKRAVALEDFEKSGRVRVDGEIWQAEVLGAGRVAQGQEIEVVSLSGMKLTVKLISK
jgi:membrane-bound serine protease (ClpP class)